MIIIITEIFRVAISSNAITRTTMSMGMKWNLEGAPYSWDAGLGDGNVDPEFMFVI